MDTFIGFCMGIALMCALSIAVIHIDDAQDGKAVVAHGCAYYDPTTSEFIWNKPDTTKK